MPTRIILFALMFLACLLRAEAVPVRVGVENASPPKWLDYVGERPRGFCADLLALLMVMQPTLAFQISPRAVPQKRMEIDLQEGRIDLICGLTRTPQRAALFHYAEPAIYALDYVLFARSDDPVAPRTWDDVRALGPGGVILLNYDSPAVGRLQRLGGLQLDATARTIEQNLRKLHSGKGRFFFYHRPGGMEEINRLKLSHSLRVVEPAFDRQPFHVLVGRHVPLPQREQLEEALRALEASGRLKDLQQHWSMQ